MTKDTKKKYQKDKKMIELENSLSGTLISIQPPSDVIQRLKERIGKLEPNCIAKRISNWELSIIIIGSVMSVAMVIFTIARTIFYFFRKWNRSIA